MTDQVLHRSIEHLHGPKEVPYGEDELIVVCLVRDGRPYVKSFVEHYCSLGVKHLMFLDNNSSDGTVEALKNYENVTVLRTKLPFKENELLFRRYLIARFGKHRWSLCVDIDELFDYPYSDVVGLGSFLGYLNSNSYTAVVAHMLDMFPEKPLSGRAGNLDEPLKESHTFYDLSNLIRMSLRATPRRLRNNTYGNGEIESFFGGIRLTVFGTRSYLTKFPLVFFDGRVRPMDGSVHWVDNAKVADLTCVLFHYKFLDEHFRKQAAQIVREEVHWSKSARDTRQLEIRKEYLKALDRNTSLQVQQETSREIKSVNDLLKNRFLVVSDNYISWVDVEEERSVLQATQSEPCGLAEAFLESRRQERAKTLEKQRLEQQPRENKESEEAALATAWRLQQRVKELKHNLARERQKPGRSKDVLTRERRKRKRLLNMLARERQKRRQLSTQLTNLQSSRTWRLVDKLDSFWSRLSGK